MHPLRDLSLPLALSVVCALPSAGQLGSPAAASTPAALSASVWRSAHGVAAVDGKLWANGPDYRVELDARGIEYAAAFGERAPTTQTARFDLVGFGRAGGPLVAGAPDVPDLSSGSAVYERGAGVQEIYATRRDGIEQSFVFAQPLAGDGDLVVRIAVTSSLARAGAADGLALEAPGLGAIAIGAVTGIDARGERVAGSLRWVGDELELALPAAFVDAAAYPLVLDPLIGTEFEVDSDAANSFDDVAPAIAHDWSAGNYLIVWARVFGLGDSDIRGQRVADNGALVGGLLAIEVGGTVSPSAQSPTVGNVNLTNMYLVAWESSSGFLAQSDIVCRSVNPATGALSANTLTVGASATYDIDPAIGGEVQLSDDDAIVVWAEFDAGIRARQVSVPAGGNPVLVGLELDVSDTVGFSYDDFEPAISKGTGYGGNFLIAWERHFAGATTPYYDLRYAVIDRNANLLVTTKSVTVSSGTDERNVAVAGDGVKFAIVYDQEPVGGGNVGIYGNRVTYISGASAPISSQITIVDSPFAESDPDVSNTGDTITLAYVGTNILSSNSPIVVQALDQVDLQPCGGSAGFSDSALDYASPVISSAAESIFNADGGTLVAFYAEDTSTSPGEIWAQRYDPVVGLNVEIIGCGGGRTEVGCALASESEAKIHVTEGIVGAPAWLILSAQPLDMPIGPCVLWADPFSGWIQSAGVVNSLGEVHTTLALAPSPGLVGVQFHAQHVSQAAGGPVTFTSGGPAYHISTAVLATFE
ncbi:MAG: hypothetical protein EPO68_04535 [Planctomycetota bacterium]|nr:MAG: hypothetical protein EPO68_04535 [Planctomycetota bacterium]